jgi:hypothetical protein
MGYFYLWDATTKLIKTWAPNPWSPVEEVELSKYKTPAIQVYGTWGFFFSWLFIGGV